MKLFDAFNLEIVSYFGHILVVHSGGVLLRQIVVVAVAYFSITFVLFLVVMHCVN